MMKSSKLIHYGDHPIPYEIIKTNKRRTRLTLKVSPRLQVSAHAPMGMNDEEIHSFVLAKSSWVYQKLEAFRQALPEKLQRDYVTGENHDYLGRPHLLKIQIEYGAIPSLQLRGNELWVTISESNPRLIKALLQRFYQQQAHLVFSERLQYLLTKTHWVKTVPELKISKMTTRWGTCSSRGKITMNYRLIKGPVECIDYVLLHELCHMKHMNHSKEFYQLLSSVLPNWSEREKCLREFERFSAGIG